jgi:hypothetical protein
MRGTLRGVEIRSDRVYRFPLPPEELWQVLVQVEEYPSWWPWVRRFDARALAPGDVWRGTIRPPLPYALRCTVALGTVVAPRLIEADVTGDLRGWGRLEVRPAVSGGPAPAAEVRVVTALAAVSLPVRLATRAVPALARWSHDWVLDTAARQFTAVLARGRARSPAPPAPPAGQLSLP